MSEANWFAEKMATLTPGAIHFERRLEQTARPGLSEQGCFELDSGQSRLLIFRSSARIYAPSLGADAWPGGAGAGHHGVEQLLSKSEQAGTFLHAARKTAALQQAGVSFQTR